MRKELLLPSLFEKSHVVSQVVRIPKMRLRRAGIVGAETRKWGRVETASNEGMGPDVRLVSNGMCVRMDWVTSAHKDLRDLQTACLKFMQAANSKNKRSIYE